MSDTDKLKRLIQLQSRQLADRYALRLVTTAEVSDEADWDWLDKKLSEDDGRQFAVLIP